MIPACGWSTPRAGPSTSTPAGPSPNCRPPRGPRCSPPTACPASPPARTPNPLKGVEQLELDLQTAAAGWRSEAFATNHDIPPTEQETEQQVTAWLDGRHRVHARVEDHFKRGNTAGAKRLPSQRYTVNTAWYRIQAIACDLIAWLKLLAGSGHLARAEPATWQFQVFHAPASLTRGGRRRWLNFPPDWPWTSHIQAVFARLFALPIPA